MASGVTGGAEASKPELAIFVLTHNRTEMAMAAIESIVNQSNSDFHLIVSDNSDQNDLENLIHLNFPSVEYRRRSSSLSAIDHANTCILEVKTGYFVLFHDDDLMLPNFVAEFQKAQKKFPKAAAFGCNAFIWQHNHTSKKPSFLGVGDCVGPLSPKGLVNAYFSRHQNGIAPLPSYIYCKEAIGQLRIDQNGGKYGDVQWLLEVAMRGLIYWINIPTMIYRLHGGNDSNSESLGDRLKFLAFLKKNPDAFDGKVMDDYRNFMYKKYQRYAITQGEKRVIMEYLRWYQFARLFRVDHYCALMYRAKLKFQTRSKFKSH